MNFRKLQRLLDEHKELTVSELLDLVRGLRPSEGRFDTLSPSEETRVRLAHAVESKPVVASARRIELSDSNDSVRMASGNDTVYGMKGNDLIDGGGGHDLLVGNAGDDTLIGGGGNDTLVGEAGNDKLFGGVGADRLYGWSGDDTLKGGAGRDALFGGAGNDKLFGGGGNDYLCGGSGIDELVGGAGADTFAFRGQEPGSVTTIKDFDTSEDIQRIQRDLVSGPLRIDMLKSFDGGLMIEFSGDRAIIYQNVFDAEALFARMSLFD
ncbi:MAG: calcium-binding protein [Gemmobacter sp.]